MTKINKKFNKHRKLFAGFDKKLRKMFPQKNIRLALHTPADNLFKIGYVKNPKMHAVSASVEFRDEDISLGLFRPGENGPTYKVDMIGGLNKELKYKIDESKFDHYIYTDIPEDIMRRNNISIEYEIDQKGNFVPKKDSKGTIRAFINFEDI